MINKELWYNPNRTKYTNKNHNEGECVFCDQENVRKYLIWETEHWIVRANAYPFIDYAILIIPKRHFEYVFETTQLEGSWLLIIMEKLAKSWSKDKENPSFNFYVNNGPLSGQTQKHLHWHFIPRVPANQTVLELLDNFHKVKVTPEETAELFKKLRC